MEIDLFCRGTFGRQTLKMHLSTEMLHDIEIDIAQRDILEMDIYRQTN